MSLDKAPIALFVYNRLDHTKKTLDALRQNQGAQDSDLIIFSDGPKKEEDLPVISNLRNYLQTVEGFKNIRIVEQEKNLGLADSIIKGVTEVISAYGKAIIMEDDLVTSKYFLKFMNEGLYFYETDDRVISIHGYCYPVKGQFPETFFLRGADCWGWATWKRGWDLFEKEGNKLLQKIKNQNLSFAFDRDGSYPFTKMLENQVNGKVGSWAIRWHASAFLENKLTLYPGQSLVKNIGHDNSGIHCSKEESFDVKLSDYPIPLSKISIEESDIGKALYIDFEKRLMRKNLAKTFLKKIRDLLAL